MLSRGYARFGVVVLLFNVAPTVVAAIALPDFTPDMSRAAATLAD